MAGVGRKKRQPAGGPSPAVSIDWKASHTHHTRARSRLCVVWVVLAVFRVLCFVFVHERRSRYAREGTQKRRSRKKERKKESRLPEWVPMFLCAVVS